MANASHYRSNELGRSVLPGRRITSLADFLLRPIFLMTRPTYYGPNPALRLEKMGAHDNIKTQASNYDDFSPTEANIQHTRLRAIKHDLGASIVLDDGDPHQFDGVYTADPGITFMHLTINRGEITGVHFDTIASNFYNHSRSGEVARHISSINFLKGYIARTFGISVSSSVHIPKLHNEGTGDNVYDPYRDMFFSGYKPKTGEFKPTQGRSDPEFHREVLWSKLEIPSFGFEVQNGFFHSDTIAAPLENGDIIAYPGGMSAEDGWRVKLMAEAERKKLIIVSEDDAHRYAPNLVIMQNRNVITATTSQKFRASIEEAGYQNHQTELSQFVEQSGGGAHCLGNRIILRRDELLAAQRLLNYEI